MKRLKIAICLLLAVSVQIATVRALECVRCDSTTDPTCVIAPNREVKEVCSEGVTQCYTQRDDATGNIVRGCKTAAGECSGAGCLQCNTADLCNIQIIPTLKCVQCSGNDCYAAQTREPTYCANYAANDQCVMQVKGAGDTARGCVSDGTFAACTDTSANCKKCSGNGCNSERSDVPWTCLTCSSDTSNACKRPEAVTEQCAIAASQDITQSECLTLPLGQQPDADICYTLQSGNSVQRGCLKDKPAAVPITAVTSCRASNCNAACVSDIATCLQCSSSTDAKCSGTTVGSTWAQTCPAYTTGCSRCISQDGTETRNCGAPADATCSFCYEKDCQAEKPKATCYKCTSNTDPNCAQWTDASKIATEECSESSQCLTIINDDKNIERRCAKKDETCPDGKQCKTCDKPNCNGGLFPENRRKCYQCSSGTDSKCSDVEQNSDTVKPAACVLYDAEEECYSYALNEDKVSMVRGCKSDAGFASCTGDKCLTCSVDNCNYFPYMRSPALKCIKCQKEDTNCAWGYAQSAAKDCANKVVYNAKESCYTHTLSDDKTQVERGCLLDVTPALTCSPTGEGACSSCNDKSGCNNKNVIDYSCIRCRSDNAGQKNCSLTAEGISGTACRNPVSFAEKGCYTDRFTEEIVIRGCIVDLDQDDFSKQNCLNETYKKCEICSDAINCNNKEAPSSASAAMGAFAILGVAFAALQFLHI